MPLPSIRLVALPPTDDSPLLRLPDILLEAQLCTTYRQAAELVWSGAVAIDGEAVRERNHERSFLSGSVLQVGDGLPCLLVDTEAPRDDTLRVIGFMLEAWTTHLAAEAKMWLKPGLNIGSFDDYEDTDD